MTKKLNLNDSQQNAIKWYLRDGYVIIESGRRSGKTETLCYIINAWRNLQANNCDNCVIICRTLSHLSEVKERLIRIFINDLMYISVKNGFNWIKFQTIDGKTVTVNFVIGIEQYFNNKYCGKYNGINISLLAGDECYISPDWCKHTACAYTQMNKIITLSYDGLIDKEEINNMRKYMSTYYFDKHIGQYL